jgi:hypothetical protein
MHKVARNDLGTPVIETFENENVKITRFLNGETETEFKPNCDPKVKEMYKQLHAGVGKCRKLRCRI